MAEDTLNGALAARGTTWPTVVPHVLTDRFAEGKHAADQWEGFQARHRPSAEVEVTDAIAAVRETVEPFFTE